MPSFPKSRMRRVRQTAWSRAMVAENQLSPADLIWPVFVQPGQNEITPVASMPGVNRMSIDVLVKEIDAAKQLGIPAIAIFPETDPAKKTDDAREAINPDNLVCRTVKAIKDDVPDIGVVCDVALDPYTCLLYTSPSPRDRG